MSVDGLDHSTSDLESASTTEPTPRWKKIARGTGRFAWGSTKFGLKAIGTLLVVLLISIVTLVTYFFWQPEIHVTGRQIRKVLDMALPANIEITYNAASLEIARPASLPFSKYITLDVDGLCVRYEGDAVNSCVEKVNLGLAGGWSGPRTSAEKIWMPRLAWIDPIVVLGAKTIVDLPKIPPSDPNEPKSNFDVVEFLRAHVLPKWRVDGTHIELTDLQILTAPKEGYVASADVTTEGDEVTAELHEFRELKGPLKVGALVRLVRPANWLDEASRADGAKNIWKLFVNSDVILNPKASLGVEADANIESWKSLDFRVATQWDGIPAVQEVRLEGKLRDADITGKVSGKFGKQGDQVQAMNFVNCGIAANLDSKTGNVLCGPETVHLRVKEQSFLHKPEFFTFSPHFELKLTRLSFGDTKEGDFEFNLNMTHFNIAKLAMHAEGSVLQKPNENLRYAVKADVNFLSERFQNIVRLMRNTIYSVPAPLNNLDGPIALTAQADFNETGGDIKYQTSTRLDSDVQAVHLRLEGTTRLISQDDSLHPKTDATLFIDDLRVSAPRFDIAVPPKFTTDARFGPIVEKKSPAAIAKQKKLIEEKAAAVEPLDLRFHIQTTQPQAIRIATNLTQAPIPIDLNLTYDAMVAAEAAVSPSVDVTPAGQPSAKTGVRTSMNAAVGKGSVSGSTTSSDAVSGASSNALPNGAETPIRPGAASTPVLTAEQVAENKLSPLSVKSKSALTGQIVIGKTPVELFRRNAVLQRLQLDLTPQGAQKINGAVTISYLDYDIVAKVLGDVSDPQLKLSSDPPLNDDQILSVLLFGRTMDELAGDEADSVRNVSAAVTNAALGLSSLYLLASTPIESVGYDAEHGIVTAKVGIGGGASLVLGSGTDNQSVGVTKRVSRQFVLRTEAIRVGTAGKPTLSALLEWVRRF